MTDTLDKDDSPPRHGSHSSASEKSSDEDKPIKVGSLIYISDLVSKKRKLLDAPVGNPERSGQAAEDLVEQGFCYLIGQGVAESPQDAIRCFEDAAALGSEAACWQLAGMYREGIGVSISNERAFYWIECAASISKNPAISVTCAYIHLLGMTAFDSIFCDSDRESVQPYSGDNDIVLEALGKLFGQLRGVLSAAGFEDINLVPKYIAQWAIGSEFLDVPEDQRLPQLLDRISAILLGERSEHEEFLRSFENFVRWVHTAITFSSESTDPTRSDLQRLLDGSLWESAEIREPIWNIEFEVIRVQPENCSQKNFPEDLGEYLWSALSDRLSKAALNGSERAKRILALAYFYLEDDLSVREEHRAKFLPTYLSEPNALADISSWELKSEDAKSFVSECLLLGWLRQMNLAPDVADEYDSLIALCAKKLGQHGRPALEYLTQALDEFFLSRGGSEDAGRAGKRHAEAMAALELLVGDKSELFIELAAQNADLRPAMSEFLVKRLLKPIPNDHPTEPIFSEILRQRLGHLPDLPGREEKLCGLRYVPSAHTMALVIRACLTSDETSRVAYLREAVERSDITARLWLARERQVSLVERRKLIREIVESLDELARNSHKWPSLSPIPQFLSKQYEIIHQLANIDDRKLLLEELCVKEREKREAEETLMALFAHKFRGPLDSILFNAEHQHDERIYIDAARTMNGLLDIFSVVSTSPEKMTRNLMDDLHGDSGPLAILTHALKLALVQLTAKRNRLRMSPHYLAYAKLIGEAPHDLRLAEWMKTRKWVEREVDIQRQWENDIGNLLWGGSISDISTWMASRLLTVDVSGFKESAVTFSDYGPKASLLTIVLTEIIVNAIKHSAPGSDDKIAISWVEQPGSCVKIVCENPSTLESRQREKSKGSGRGHSFLGLIAAHLQGRFSAHVTQDNSIVEITFPVALFLGEHE